MFFLSHGVALRMSCPYTSRQNGKAERSIRTINNIMCSLLFQASLPPVYRVEALHTATYLVNRLPTKTLAFFPSHLSLFHSALLRPSSGFRLCLLSQHVIHGTSQTHPPIPLYVFSLGIPQNTRAIGVLNSNPIAFSSLDMSFL